MNLDRSVLAFTWNADGLRICETESEKHAKDHRTGFLSLFRKTKPCKVPTFFREIGEKIRRARPDIVCFSTQEEAGNRTYFHAEFLPEEMETLGYIRYSYQKLGDVGRFNMSDRKTPVPTGTPNSTALRFSVYIIATKFERYKMNREYLDEMYSDEPYFNESAHAGAVAKYLKEGNGPIICLTAVDIPILEDRVSKSSLTGYIKRSPRRTANSETIISDIMEFFFYREVRRQKPSYFFMMGDFGLNVNARRSRSRKIVDKREFIEDLRRARERDEFHAQDYDMEEDTRASVVPTWPYKKEESPECSGDDYYTRSECYDGKIIGWRDRIVYKTVPNHTIVATDVGTLHGNTIDESSHKAVYGLYTLSSTVRPSRSPRALQPRDVAAAPSMLSSRFAGRGRGAPFPPAPPAPLARAPAPSAPSRPMMGMAPSYSAMPPPQTGNLGGRFNLSQPAMPYGGQYPQVPPPTYNNSSPRTFSQSPSSPRTTYAFQGGRGRGFPSGR